MWIFLNPMVFFFCSHFIVWGGGDVDHWGSGSARSKTVPSEHSQKTRKLRATPKWEEILVWAVKYPHLQDSAHMANNDLSNITPPPRHFWTTNPWISSLPRITILTQPASYLSMLLLWPLLSFQKGNHTVNLLLLRHLTNLSITLSDTLSYMQSSLYWCHWLLTLKANLMIHQGGWLDTCWKKNLK